MNIDDKMKGIVFNIQRFSIHDGPGIRTIVFLKGCPLSCKWCSNPESQSPKPEMMFNRSLCTGCGRCEPVCKVRAIRLDQPYRIDKSICTGCGKCASACINGALEQKGGLMSVAEVMEVLQKDSIYYRRSGGGVTLSGGEPLMQSEFSAELLKACQAMGWHTAIETTVFASAEAVERVFPHVDLALMDIKCIDHELHRRFTGCDNDMILKHAVLGASIARTVVRIPVIPGFNDGIGSAGGEIRKICRFAKTLPGVDTIHLLPYHTYGENKYRLTGKEYSLKGVTALAEQDLGGLAGIVEEEGFTCILGG